jgi:hypothetical protein
MSQYKHLDFLKVPSSKQQLSYPEDDKETSNESPFCGFPGLISCNRGSHNESRIVFYNLNVFVISLMHSTHIDRSILPLKERCMELILQNTVLRGSSSRDLTRLCNVFDVVAIASGWQGRVSSPNDRCQNFPWAHVRDFVGSGVLKRQI